MGFFDKKICELCGEKASMMTKLKLEDGYLCSTCKKKLSCFSEGWKRRSIEDVKQHLAQREANREKYQQFSVQQVCGPRGVLKVDRTHHWFVLARGRDWDEENPEVFDGSQLREFYIDVSFDAFSDDDDGDGIPDHLEATQRRNTSVSFQGGTMSMRSGTTAYGAVLNADTLQQFLLSTGSGKYVRMSQDRYDSEGFPKKISSMRGVIKVRHPYISKLDLGYSGNIDDPGEGEQLLSELLEVMRACEELRSGASAMGGMAPGQSFPPQTPMGSPAMVPPMTGFQDNTNMAMGHHTMVPQGYPPQQMQQPIPGGTAAAGGAGFCPSCGAQRSGGKFCASCGAQLP
ncbi:MAG: DUF4428 domain-containing protein [Actinomycetaceae bacterium]|nr:DUF4428 domain-containing protein [Actinomycetaceae bacterium]